MWIHQQPTRPWLVYNAPLNVGDAENDPPHTTYFFVKLKEHCDANQVPRQFICHITQNNEERQ